MVSGFDIETTGLSKKDGHRMIEAAILHYDFDTRKLVDKWVQRIDPERSIDAKSQAVHGIAYDDLVGCAKFDAVAPRLVQELNWSDLTVIHNGGFDAPFTNAELKRLGLHVRPDSCIASPVHSSASGRLGAGSAPRDRHHSRSDASPEICWCAWQAYLMQFFCAVVNLFFCALNVQTDNCVGA
nr:exonuclease domain-containing protein [Paraburkholderia tagetis]